MNGLCTIKELKKALVLMDIVKKKHACGLTYKSNKDVYVLIAA